MYLHMKFIYIYIKTYNMCLYMYIYIEIYPTLDDFELVSVIVGSNSSASSLIPMVDSVRPANDRKAHVLSLRFAAVAKRITGKIIE